VSENYQRLGNFVLLEKLNAGGMAEVYLAKSIGASGVNKFFAIKRILPQYADNREFIDMFKEEAKIAVNLDHSNVVSIIDFKADKNQLYLVMDYVQGQNLRQVLQQKKKKNLELNLPFIVYIVREVAAGLEHAHKCMDKTSGKALNIIHRDMSPQNIMVSYDGAVKIVDFGIAKAETAGESTKVGTLKGKFSYMSPEQAEGQIVDQLTDIFSLGIILWELIADDRLFIANNEVNILKRIKECDIPDIRRVVPTIPPELEKIVKKALMKDKTLRYQNSGELIKDLTRFLNKEYPDFTKTDFATFVTFLFEDEYKANQNQLVKYAKIQLESLPNTPQQQQYETALSRTFSVNNASKDGPPKGMVDQTHHSVVKPSKALIDGNIKSEIKKSNLTQAFQKNAPPPPVNKNNSSVSKIYNFSKSGSPGTSVGPAPTQIRYKSKSKSPFDGLSKLLTLIVLAAGLGYGIVHSKFIKRWPPWAATTVAPPQPSPTTGTIDNASTDASKFMVYIQSNPGKARIYLNSKDTGLFTPSNIEVEPNSPFTITLLADGYLPYTGRYTATFNGQKLSATLMQISIGYLNITVVNAGVDTVIFVNGLRLQEKPPINRYPVPAGTPVKIRVEHAFSQTSAETTVTVGKDEKKDVELILTANPPSKEEQQNNGPEAKK
jgi:serine/threonine-protein kinase